MRKVLLPALALTLASLTACSAFSDDTGSVKEGGKPQIAAAFYPLEFLADRIGGDLVDVTDLTQAGGEPHDLEIGIQQTAALTEADLIVFESDFQPAVDDSVEQNAEGEVLDVADVVDLQEFGTEEGEAVDHEHSDDEHSDEDHSDEDHSDEDHAGHDHGSDSGTDPHFWLDPARMAEVGDAMAERLAEIDPDHAEDYRTNAEALHTELTDLDTAFTDGLADCQRDIIVSTHDAFGYWDKYGVYVAPVVGLTPDAEPTPAALSRLQQLIKDEGITTIFYERLASTRYTDSLKDDLDLSTEVLDPVEALTEETASQDYVSLMQSNLAAVRQANGCR